MKRVFVNGYGSIGSRIAAFVSDDPQVELVGVGKHSPGPAVARASARGLRVFAPASKAESFEGASGTIEEALDSSDIVIDASPAGSGYANKTELYGPRGIKAIYQGGESVSGPGAVSDLLFNSRANYDEALGRSHVMQGSCNVTGMGRMLGPLREKYGDRLARFDVTLVRRWADIEQDAEVPDTVEMTQNPHHGSDAKQYLGSEAPLHVRAIKVPTRQMHLHILDVRFRGGAPPPEEVHGALSGELGVALLWTAKGTAQVRSCASQMGFGFSDTNMIHVHANMTRTVGDTVHMMYSDDQTGIVIPENHMLMQAMLFGRPRPEAAAHTESVFHMEEKKRRLQETFAR